MCGLVSVIINVYNCKAYLQKALDSVREQTYHNLEVILVDDCSTDGSGEFCDEYCKQDARFRVIHHEKNTGVSGPRNTGLREAKGEYIYFMDSDDYIHLEAIEALVDALDETGLELAVFDFEETDSVQKDRFRPREKKALERVPSDKMIYEMLLCLDGKWNVVWNKLYKRSLIEGLCLNDYYSIQDQDFNIRVYQRIEEAALIPERLYWYVRNPNSMQHSPAYAAKRFYLNTVYRFKMLDHILPGKNERKYREWIIGYGYFQMMERREIEKGTAYETDFIKLCKDIIRKTWREFLFMKYYPMGLRKRIKYFVFLVFPKWTR